MCGLLRLPGESAELQRRNRVKVSAGPYQLKVDDVLGWVVTFFVIAIIAAVFGFTGIAAGAAAMAKVLFFIFLVVFLVTLVMHLVRGRTPRL